MSSIKKIRRIRIILELVSLAAALLGMLFDQLQNVAVTTFFLIIAGIGILGYLIFTLLFWHCPHCMRMLPIKNGMWHKCCPHCGEELDREQTKPKNQ